MNTLKKSVSALTAGIVMASPTFADGFELADGLTMTGFLDMSYVVVEPDDGDSVTDSGVDQFELNFNYDFGQGLTTVIDLEYDYNGEPEQETHIEQAYINYAINENLNFKAGRFLSYSGWETEDPTGLFQYSGTGYAKYFYGAYQQGFSLNYSGGMLGAAISIVNDPGTLKGDERDGEDPAVELMLALSPSESVTAKAFYITDKSDANGETIDMFNVWASYSAGGLTLAAEYNASENTGAAVAIAGDEAEATGYLLMANYAWDKFGVTLRYHGSEVETESGTTVEDITGITIAPSYQIHENLLLVAEYRMDEEDESGAETDQFALEALLTF